MGCVFRYTSDVFVYKLRKRKKNLCRCSRPSDSESKPGPLSYEAGLLATNGYFRSN
jgi:hypothetical protein